MNANALALLAIMLPGLAWGQGYAGLGGAADDFAQVTPPADLQFPRDHGAHPDFRVEWWYLTANLEDAEGAAYGIQWTLFRVALDPGPTEDGWRSNQVWFGHAGLTTADTHRFAETWARGGTGQAGVTLDPFAAWIDDWALQGTPGPGDALARLAVTAGGADFSYVLEVESDHAPVPQGEDGFSLKGSESLASYYYSQPFYAVAGTLVIDGEPVAVTGTGWLDREWSSQPLRENQTGWDWFSLHLDSGERVMLYRLRQDDGGAALAGTWITPDGMPEPLPEDGIEMTPISESEVAGRRVPTAWRVAIPGRGFAVDTTPLNPQSWMGTSFPYWEGPIRFEGSHEGRGYLEMTGYD